MVQTFDKTEDVRNPVSCYDNVSLWLL